jgi:uncharacterized membrane protein YkvA (DUF1232 family)
MSKISTVRSARNMRGALHLLQNRKTLWHMLREVVHGKYKMSLLTNMAFVLGFLYIISPLDFDWIPIIGWVDDGFVGYMVIKRLQKETQRYNRHKAMERRLHND